MRFKNKPVIQAMHVGANLFAQTPPKQTRSNKFEPTKISGPSVSVIPERFYRVSSNFGFLEYIQETRHPKRVPNHYHNQATTPSTLFNLLRRFISLKTNLLPCLMTLNQTTQGLRIKQQSQLPNQILNLPVITQQTTSLLNR